MVVVCLLVQGVALYGAFFFFQKLAVSVALNGAGCAGSVAMLHHLVPERIPLQKPSKTCFLKGKKSLWTRQVSVRVLRYMVRVALFHATSRRTV